MFFYLLFLYVGIIAMILNIQDEFKKKKKDKFYNLIGPIFMLIFLSVLLFGLFYLENKKSEYFFNIIVEHNLTDEIVKKYPNLVIDYKVEKYKEQLKEKYFKKEQK
jgi:amino acid transporter